MARQKGGDGAKTSSVLARDGRAGQAAVRPATHGGSPSSALTPPSAAPTNGSAAAVPPASAHAGGGGSVVDSVSTLNGLLSAFGVPPRDDIEHGFAGTRHMGAFTDEIRRCVASIMHGQQQQQPAGASGSRGTSASSQNMAEVLHRFLAEQIGSGAAEGSGASAFRENAASIAAALAAAMAAAEDAGTASAAAAGDAIDDQDEDDFEPSSDDGGVDTESIGDESIDDDVEEDDEDEDGFETDSFDEDEADELATTDDDDEYETDEGDAVLEGNGAIAAQRDAASDSESTVVVTAQSTREEIEAASAAVRAKGRRIRYRDAADAGTEGGSAAAPAYDGPRLRTTAGAAAKKPATTAAAGSISNSVPVRGKGLARAGGAFPWGPEVEEIQRSILGLAAQSGMFANGTESGNAASQPGASTTTATTTCSSCQQHHPRHLADLLQQEYTDDDDDDGMDDADYDDDDEEQDGEYSEDEDDEEEELELELDDDEEEDGGSLHMPALKRKRHNLGGPGTASSAPRHAEADGGSLAPASSSTGNAATASALAPHGDKGRRDLLPCTRLMSARPPCIECTPDCKCLLKEIKASGNLAQAMLDGKIKPSIDFHRGPKRKYNAPEYLYRKLWLAECDGGFWRWRGRFSALRKEPKVFPWRDLPRAVQESVLKHMEYETLMQFSNTDHDNRMLCQEELSLFHVTYPVTLPPTLSRFTVPQIVDFFMKALAFSVVPADMYVTALFKSARDFPEVCAAVIAQLVAETSDDDTPRVHQFFLEIALLASSAFVGKEPPPPNVGDFIGRLCTLNFLNGVELWELAYVMLLNAMRLTKDGGTLPVKEMRLIMHFMRQCPPYSSNSIFIFRPELQEGCKFLKDLAQTKQASAKDMQTIRLFTALMDGPPTP